MADPDAAIRDLLDDPKRYLENGIGPLVAALLAVLELKRRNHEDWTHFDETAYEFGKRCGLEQAADAIAEALGLEVDGG